MSDSDGITARQERALTHLLSSTTIRAAAAAAGVGEATLHRWLGQPAFRSAYRAARRRAAEQTTARLQTCAADAVTTLIGVMANPASPPSVKVAAARAVIEFAQRAGDWEDLSVRIASLEEEVRQKP